MDPKDAAAQNDHPLNQNDDSRWAAYFKANSRRHSVLRSQRASLSKLL